ncbi:dioxygenase [Planoprotostelium fungivorum]|uniref:Dioxygenase n=1 Tax=Planoprotostelium fungivorum TaxID=1890364 RepID=A0A2P6NX54_9EUKA|nr:dioxygenase [Planoprotostelium fungivorum]
MTTEAPQVNLTSPFGDKNVPETPQPTEVPVQGKIPEWVEGILYRTGLGKFSVVRPDGTIFHFHHPFDGLSMIHRFEIRKSDTTKVYYSSRHVANGVEKRIGQKDSTLVFFGPDPCKTVFGKVQSVWNQVRDQGKGTIARRMEEDAQGENINVTVTPNFPLSREMEETFHEDHGLALVVKTDGNMLQLLDKDTLEPKKVFTYGHVDKNPVLGGRFAAAHHQEDTETGEFFNFILEPFPVATWHVFSLKKGEKEEKARVFDQVRWNLSSYKGLLPLNPSYSHSFFLTKNYVILPNWSYYFRWNVLGVLWYGNAYESLKWDPEVPTLFHVLCRKTGKHVATYMSDPAFAFHTANAWDEEEVTYNGKVKRNIFMDVCTYKDTGIIEASFEFGRMKEHEGRGTYGSVDINKVKPASYVHKKGTGTRRGEDRPVSELRRYKLSDVPTPDLPESEFRPVQPRTAGYQLMCYDIDLARFNPLYHLKPYRYLWGTTASQLEPTIPGHETIILSALTKRDLNEPEKTKRWDAVNCSASEPVFIPRPGAEAEDDGVILSLVNQMLTGEITEKCFLLVLDASSMKEVARAEVGNFHAKTVHGSFVDGNRKAVSIN